MPFKIRKPLIVTASLLSLLLVGPYALAKVDSKEGAEEKTPIEYHFGFAGDYLASHFAQHNSDWGAAYGFLDRALASGNVYEELHKRAMILAVGAGRIDDAIAHTEKLMAFDPENRLALLVLSANAIAEDRADDAVAYIEKMPEGDIANFVKPLMLGWAYAQKGELASEHFTESSFHTYHHALIAYYLGKKDRALELTEMLLEMPDLSMEQYVRGGALLAALGKREKALEIFEMAAQEAGNERRVVQALEILKTAAPYENTDAIVHEVKTAKQGAAQAIYDMALVLYQEQSPGSARLFANLALHLNPDMARIHILLAEALIESERYMDAREHLLQIKPSHYQFLEAQRQAANLLAEAGDFKRAQKELKTLYETHDDLNALIDAGHIYRQKEDYESALILYNKVVKKLGGTVPEEYWYLLYARGMANEREGHWDDAVADLTAALEYRPNHPFILNYLGYGWADKGDKLDKSLEIIKKAASLQPRDGYIIDSLGWVYYRMGDYESAVNYLEKAVEYLPYDSTINDHLGDAYWQYGRKLEAKFQWERAFNYAEETETTLKEKIQAKLDGRAVPDTHAKKVSQKKGFNE